MAPRFENVRAVLFDWDGTLLDSYQADQQAYLAMFRTMGIPWRVEDLERHYSPDWYRVYRAARLPRTQWQRADRVWRLHYGRQWPMLLPHAKTVLRTMGNLFQLGLVTSGSRARVLQQLSGFELTRLFAARVYSESVAYRETASGSAKACFAQPADCSERCRVCRRLPGRHPDGTARRSSNRSGVRTVSYTRTSARGERRRAAGINSIVGGTFSLRLRTRSMLRL